MIRILALAILPLVALFGSAAEAAPFHSDRISVETRGKGPDVVLIPGLSSSPKVWEGAVAAVPGYRYHLVHVAGFDGAPAGANASGPVVAPVAEEIARYIKESHLNRPAIVGHSLGGTWAMMIGARHPELASRLMVVDMMPYLGAMFAAPGAAPDAVTHVAEQIRTGIATSKGDARRASVEQTVAGMVKTESLRAGPVAQSLASDPVVSGQAMYEIITTDLRPELRNIKVPMTVLWVVPGGAPVTEAQLDQFYHMSYANAPQAVLKNIPDSYHFIMLDQPAVFAAELKAFLKP
jgi:pimeloyl-ACP methyl ester carboxylesterase